MVKGKARYFNFPIILLKGFLINHRDVLNNIIEYAMYVHCKSYLEKDGFEWTINVENNIKKLMSLSESFFGVKTNDKMKTFKNGKILFQSIPDKTPMVGLNIDIFLDFYNNEKDEFEKVCLLGFLAIKSIVQNKPYCKIVNKFWLSRMEGNAKSINEISELSIPIRKYANEYQTKKIKNELIDNWGLKHYSRYTRGFYVSFILSLEELVFEAENRRKSNKAKQRKLNEKIAIEKALNRLYQK